MSGKFATRLARLEKQYVAPAIIVVHEGEAVEDVMRERGIPSGAPVHVIHVVFGDDRAAQDGG